MEANSFPYIRVKRKINNLGKGGRIIVIVEREIIALQQHSFKVLIQNNHV